MKRFIQAVAVAVLFSSSFAKAEDAPIVLTAPSTWANQHGGAQGAKADAFAGSIDEMIVLTGKSTGADRRADRNEAMVMAFPGNSLPALSD